MLPQWVLYSGGYRVSLFDVVDGWTSRYQGAGGFFEQTAPVIQYVPRVGGFIWCVTEVLSAVMIRVIADPAGRCQLLRRWFAVGAGFEWMYVDPSRVARRPLDVVPTVQTLDIPVAFACSRAGYRSAQDLS